MTIEDVLNLIAEDSRETVKEFLTGLEAEAKTLKAIDSKEKATEFIKSNDMFKRAFDSEVSTKVDKYKVDNFDLAVEKEVGVKLKELEDKSKKTPEQERIATLEEKIKQAEVRDALNTRKDLTILELANRDLDIKAASLIVSDSDEKTRLNIDSFEGIVGPFKKKIDELQKELKTKGAQTGQPGNGNNFDGIKNPFKFGTDGQPGRNADMIGKLYKENPTLYNQFLTEHRATK